MRQPIAALAVAVALGFAGAASAQVTVDPNALDALNPPGTAKTPATGAARPAARPERSGPRHPPAHPVAKPAPAKPAAVAAKPPSVPTTAPPAPVIPPPIVVPTRPPPPPVAVSVLPDAPGEAIAEKGGLRLTFGAQRADLNPTTDAALRRLVHDAPPGDGTTFTVTAYAAGNEDDPSTARRMSLARALAVRSVMITEGVASIRIYVKALGAPIGAGADEPPDRVDIAVTGALGASTAAATAAVPAPSAAVPASPSAPASAASHTP